MVPKGSLILAALVAVVLLVPAAAAQDQTRVAETDLKLSTNPFLSVGNTLARDSQTQGFVDWEFCHAAGGFNPQNAQFELTLTIEDAPAWLDVTIGGEPTHVFTPPVGPTVNQNEACPPDTKGTWDLFARSSRDAPYGEKATVAAVVTVAETASQHTYQVPADGRVTLSVEIESDPGDDITRQLEQNATGNPGATPTTNNQPNEPEESPPAPVFAFLMGVVLLVAVLRRR